MTTYHFIVCHHPVAPSLYSVLCILWAYLSILTGPRLISSLMCISFVYSVVCTEYHHQHIRAPKYHVLCGEGLPFSLPLNPVRFRYYTTPTHPVTMTGGISVHYLPSAPSSHLVM
ncbi:hypothetical protein FKM82_028582 [Ascaphus truei]